MVPVLARIPAVREGGPWLCTTKNREETHTRCWQTRLAAAPGLCDRTAQNDFLAKRVPGGVAAHAATRVCGLATPLPFWNAASQPRED
jgi:hypothetical protein